MLYTDYLTLVNFPFRLIALKIFGFVDRLLKQDIMKESNFEFLLRLAQIWKYSFDDESLISHDSNWSSYAVVAVSPSTTAHNNSFEAIVVPV